MSERSLIINGQKKCARCNLFRPLDHFRSQKTTSTGKYSYCRPCQREMSRNYYRTHFERCRISRKAKTRAIKMRVLEAYGGKPPECSCCFDGHVEFLTIDHLNNNGSTHRRVMGRKGGTATYQWLINHGFPSGFQVLCMNCNFSKGAFGFCPHRPDEPRRDIRHRKIVSQ